MHCNKTDWVTATRGTRTREASGTSLEDILSYGRPPGTKTTIDVNHYRCPITRLGKGQPIICIHGLGHDQWDFTSFFKGRENGFELIALDLPGFGLSQLISTYEDTGFPGEPVLTLDTLVETVEALIATSSIPPILLGSSLGGHIALEIGLKAPDSLRGLILASPGGLKTYSDAEKILLREYYSPSAISSRTDETIESNNRRIFHKNCPAQSELAQRKLAYHHSARAPRYAKDFSSIVNDVLKHPIESRLDELRCPSVLIFGAQDQVVPVELGVSASNTLNAPLHIFEECGHLPMVEDPNTFCAIAFQAARNFSDSRALNLSRRTQC